MKRLSFFFLIPLFGLSQSTVNIEHLDGPINTYGADLNFFQFNDSSAYYTAMTEDNNYQSSIYLARKKRNKWKRTGYSQFNSEKFNTGDICFLNNNEAIFSFCDLDENCKLIFFSEGNFSKINTINNIGKKNIQGNFDRGDVNEVMSESGEKIAIGLAGYSAEDSNAIKGHKSDEIAKILSYSHREEMIHKDDLVLI